MSVIGIQHKNPYSRYRFVNCSWIKDSKSRIHTPYGDWFISKGKMREQPISILIAKETPIKNSRGDLRRRPSTVSLVVIFEKHMQRNFEPIVKTFPRPTLEDPEFTLRLVTNSFEQKLSENNLDLNNCRLSTPQKQKIYERIKSTLLKEVISELNKILNYQPLSEVDSLRATYVGRLCSFDVLLLRKTEPS